ncbi:GNAT family N-acetyltransferase [uncultured Winogradskyella sp.]|uniref:GNAT family N-acetyltransferase n=1 Tax=uncultured Winogradskyella sp. TaxID=395353 RepID=UPI0026058903|nr:GNAT family N-acetyltransferase [uncultured Winogradskyella sp.]
MDYHNDRFQDHSLMIYKNDKLIALLPANKVNGEVFSHQGLSYGGFINNKNLKSEDGIQIFKTVLKFLSEKKIDSLIIKELPGIYLHNVTNNAMSYLYFKVNAELLRTDMHSVVDLNFKSYSSSRKEGLKRGHKHGLIVKESNSFDLFWKELLIPNLKSKHGVQPVHSLKEINLLKSRFPENVRQFNVFYNDKIVGGTTIFETSNVAHCQYISGNTNKNELGSLDFLHAHLLDVTFKDKTYCSFGTSNIEAGQKVNKGLQFWKEGFGARSITQGFYKIKTDNYKLLDGIFV